MSDGYKAGLNTKDYVAFLLNMFFIDQVHDFRSPDSRKTKTPEHLNTRESNKTFFKIKCMLYGSLSVIYEIKTKDRMVDAKTNNRILKYFNQLDKILFPNNKITQQDQYNNLLYRFSEIERYFDQEKRDELYWEMNPGIPGLKATIFNDDEYNEIYINLQQSLKKSDGTFWNTGEFFKCYHYFALFKASEGWTVDNLSSQEIIHILKSVYNQGKIDKMKGNIVTKKRQNNNEYIKIIKALELEIFTESLKHHSDMDYTQSIIYYIGLIIGELWPQIADIDIAMLDDDEWLYDIYEMIEWILKNEGGGEYPDLNTIENKIADIMKTRNNIYMYGTSEFNQFMDCIGGLILSNTDKRYIMNNSGRLGNLNFTNIVGADYSEKLKKIAKNSLAHTEIEVLDPQIGNKYLMPINNGHYSYHIYNLDNDEDNIIFHRNKEWLAINTIGPDKSHIHIFEKIASDFSKNTWSDVTRDIVHEYVNEIYNDDSSIDHITKLENHKFITYIQLVKTLGDYSQIFSSIDPTLGLVDSHISPTDLNKLSFTFRLILHRDNAAAYANFRLTTTTIAKQIERVGIQLGQFHMNGGMYSINQQSHVFGQSAFSQQSMVQQQSIPQHSMVQQQSMINPNLSIQQPYSNYNFSVADPSFIPQNNIHPVQSNVSQPYIAQHDMDILQFYYTLFDVGGNSFIVTNLPPNYCPPEAGNRLSSHGVNIRNIIDLEHSKINDNKPKSTEYKNI